MAEKISWRSVFLPAKGDAFFEGHEPLKQWPPANNAHAGWFFSECARLCYQHDTEARRSTLAAIGWEERCWYNEDDLAAGIWCCADVTVLCFRGTCQPKNWSRNLDTQMQACPYGGHVHSGFYEAFLICWAALKLTLPPTRPLICCGHSLGAAMASIAMLEKDADALYTYGSPRLGDKTFTDLFNGRKTFRYCNSNDIVTHLPPSRRPFTCAHIGEALWLGEKKRKRDRFKARLKHPETWLNTPSQLSDHAPITYTSRISALI